MYLNVLKLDRMLMVGSTGANVGKTELACRIIKKFAGDTELVGIKVTTIKEKDGHCPRGGQGCGVCASLEGDFDVIQETDETSDKDTARLLRAGAAKVFWLRSMKGSLAKGFAALLDVVGPDSTLVCESNSLRRVVEPGLFIMVKSREQGTVKESAQQVMDYADEVVNFGDEFDIDGLVLIDGKWRLMNDAAAVILAGGESSRMGKDKSLLPVNDKPIVQIIYEQLRGSFREILIGGGEVEKLKFLNLQVIPDRQSGQGPLMGIASALQASSNEINFVIACDIPHVDLITVRKMLKEAEGFDIVIPIFSKIKQEPLFAIYKKSALKAINETLEAGQRKISDAFARCRVKYIDLELPQSFVNLNTMKEYRQYRSRFEI